MLEFLYNPKAHSLNIIYITETLLFSLPFAKERDRKTRYSGIPMSARG